MAPVVHSPSQELSAESTNTSAYLGSASENRLEDIAWNQDIGEPTSPLEPKAAKYQPLAIVGFSLKFPQEATSTESFWAMMMDGRSSMTEYPESRMRIDAFYRPDATRRDTVSDGANLLGQSIENIS